jgi:hypothetical protein
MVSTAPEAPTRYLVTGCLKSEHPAIATRHASAAFKNAQADAIVAAH